MERLLLTRLAKSSIAIVASAAIFAGCGGGGGGSVTSTSVATPTDVTVERGAIFGAKVTDANGIEATATEGSNVYKFADTPKYPIKAVGGVIDIDGNPATTTDQIDFTGKELRSYSTVITPITDYLGDTSQGSGLIKLEELQKKYVGLSTDELLKKVPSAVGKNELFVLTNAIYSVQNDTSITDKSLENITNKFDTLKVIAEDHKDDSKEEIAKILEEKVISDLGIKKIFTLASTNVSDKQISAEDSEGVITIELKRDGSYSEAWDDSKSQGNKGTCSGTWEMGTAKNTVNVKGTCSDKNPVETTLTFKEEPKVNSKFSYSDTDGSKGEVTITSIKDVNTLSAKEITIDFDAVVGNEKLVCSENGAAKKYILGKASTETTIADFRYFVSNIKVNLSDGTTQNLTLTTNDFQYQVTDKATNVAILDFEDKTGNCYIDAETNTKIVGTIPATLATVTGIEFMVGVPLELNHVQFPDSKALIRTGMVWSWQSGRKFTKLETQPVNGLASFNTTTQSFGTPSLTGKFTMHLGSTGCTATEAMHIAGTGQECAQPNRVDLKFTAFNPEIQKIVLDYSKLLTSVDISKNYGGAAGCMSGLTDPECMSTGTVAGSMFKQFGLDDVGAIGKCIGADCTENQELFSIKSK